MLTSTNEREIEMGFSYAIKNAKTNKYFAGFVDGESVWENKEMAVTFTTKLMASAQAQLLKKVIKDVRLTPEAKLIFQI